MFVSIAESNANLFPETRERSLWLRVDLDRYFSGAYGLGLPIPPCDILPNAISANGSRSLGSLSQSISLTRRTFHFFFFFFFLLLTLVLGLLFICCPYIFRQSPRQLNSRVQANDLGPAPSLSMHRTGRGAIADRYSAAEYHRRINFRRCVYSSSLGEMEDGWMFSCRRHEVVRSTKRKIGISTTLRRSEGRL